MKKCIIAVQVLLLCATSVYALGKKDDTPPSSGSVSTSSSSSATKKTSGKTTSSTSSTSSKATSATTTGRPVTEDEKALHQAAGGSTVNYDAVIVVEGKLPTVQEVREAGNSVGSKTIASATDAEIRNLADNSDGMTLPPSTIYLGEPANTDVESKALMAHELEHVAQYQGDPGQV